ncbi:MAG: gamma-glutamyltransferase [Xanthomonadales bacterium]|nr:gamma-glutamyltransferase [Xanthomonadales bacterium]
MKFLNKTLLLLAAVLISASAMAVDKPGKSAISSAHYLATEAGFEVLEQGGNAFDAAVAVSAALAVVEPASSGIGGGAFWLLHRNEDQKNIMIDGREEAPSAAHRDMYLDENGEVNRGLATQGPLAAGIPGHVAGMVHIASNYGRLPLKVSLAPAIRLAREGFPADEKYIRLLKPVRKYMLRFPAGRAIFLHDDEIPALGAVIKQPDLAHVLEQVVLTGTTDFYHGETARLLVKGVKEAGGIWALEDLAAYKVVEREPVRFKYNDYELITASPPSSGGVAIAEILNILEPYKISERSQAQRTHLVVEAMRRAYRDRSIYLGDPGFVDVPVSMLIDPHYAAGMRTSIRIDKATPSSSLAGIVDVAGGKHTTHFSIIDSEGNLVAATLTVNTLYGANFVAPGTGFLLNNQMDDFSAKPGKPNAYGLIGFEANAIAPGKRPLSSMSPTFVIGKDRVAVLGTPGGSRIITMVLLSVLDFFAGNGPQSWVALPRYHHQYLPDRIYAEPDAFSEELQSKLRALGHEVQILNRQWGNMNAVMWDRRSGKLEAASDPRTPSGRATVK